MMRFVRGNLFNSKAQTLVNSVNCVGVMGKGVAKEFRDRWPEMFKAYQAACRRGELRSGRPFLWRESDRLILNVPTKDNWKEPSKYEFVEAGLKAIRDHYQEWGITSLALPPLGCGLGGLEWEKVRVLMTEYLGNLPIEIEAFEPFPDDRKVGNGNAKREIKPVHVTLPLAIVGELIRRTRKEMPSDVPLGKLAVQKLAFFAQFAGAPIRLRFDQYKFGPYDHRLNYMIERLEGLYVRDVSPTRSTSNLMMLDEPAWLLAIEPLQLELEPFQKYIASAVELIDGRPTREIELLATIHYSWCAAVASGLEGSEEEVDDYVGRWSQEKKEKFPLEEIRKAMHILAERGWLGPAAPDRPSPLVNPAPEPGEEIFA